MNPSSERKIILVVSDESDTRTFLMNLLHAVRMESIAACSIEEGLALAKSQYPALIILDVMMADKAGMTCYRRLRTDPVTQKIPVIMLSAIDRETFFSYQRFQKAGTIMGVAGPEAYLEKPPEGEELLGLVTNLTRGGP